MPEPPPSLPTWRTATQQALYGAAGFYRRAPGPAGHFRTSVHASTLVAEAVLSLARSAGLGCVVDVGSGGGELLAALHRLDPGLRLVGVDLADRPAALPAEIAWAETVPQEVEGLLVANEWLDNIAVDVAVRGPAGVHLVLVDPATGDEQSGPPAAVADRAWLDRWWPLPAVGDRAEVGHPRDAAWAGAVGGLRRGLAVAVDYAHRSSDRPAGGTLTGHRAGRRVRPVPDGSCDITAHVALDACAAAGLAAGAGWSVLTSQAQALDALVGRAPRPTYDDARLDPAGYLARLARSGEAAELRRAGGLGDFGWLVQGVGVAQPLSLSRLAAGG